MSTQTDFFFGDPVIYARTHYRHEEELKKRVGHEATIKSRHGDVIHGKVSYWYVIRFPDGECYRVGAKWLVPGGSDD